MGKGRDEEVEVERVAGFSIGRRERSSTTAKHDILSFS